MNAVPHTQRTIPTCTDNRGLVQFYHRIDTICVSFQHPRSIVRQIPHPQRTIITSTDNRGLVQFYHRIDTICVSFQHPRSIVRQIPHPQRTIITYTDNRGLVLFYHRIDRIFVSSQLPEVSFVKSHTRNVRSLLALTIVVSFNFTTELTLREWTVVLVCPINTR